MTTRQMDAGELPQEGEHFAASDQFDAIFKEGMGLVERTAAYLDGPGRKEARALRGPVAVLYATESMRLTTRLLELASWRKSSSSGIWPLPVWPINRRCVTCSRCSAHPWHQWEAPPR